MNKHKDGFANHSPPGGPGGGPPRLRGGVRAGAGGGLRLLAGRVLDLAAALHEPLHCRYDNSMAGGRSVCIPCYLARGHTGFETLNLKLHELKL